MKLAAKPSSPAIMMTTGKGTAKKKMPMKAAAASAIKRAIMERPLSDADHRLDNDCKNRCLQPEKKRRHQRRLPPQGVDVAQAHDADDAGKDEKPPAISPPSRPVHQPADISRKLLRLGAGQQHAVIERMEKPRSDTQRFSSTRMRCMTAI